jgi:hypothetical protein
LKAAALRSLAVLMMLAGGSTTTVRGQPRTSPPQMAQQPAKADLSEAAKTARAWRDDAVVCSISTAVADAGGAAQRFGGWDYRFCAKSAGEEYAVAHTPTGFSGSVIGKADKAPLPADFIDSDRAMAAAKRAGFTPKGNTLMELNSAPDGKGVVWVVYDIAGLADANKQFQVDAKTGNVVQAGK